MNESRVFAAILAGGTGSRMGNVEKPKQFLHIGDKPIIIHTIEKFYMNDRFTKVLALCPEDWMEYSRKIIDKYLPDNDVVVLAGGSTRNETILNAAYYVEKEYGLNDDPVLVTHDAVRPFVTHRIIMDNIRVALDGYAVDTVIPAADTIVESTNDDYLTNIPERKYYYLGQTPQSFKAKAFKDLYLGLSEEEKEILTDAAKVFVMNGKTVKIVKGETFNNKVTYSYDLQLAETLLKGVE